MSEIVEIIDIKKWTPNKPLVLVGMPGPGLVGPIAGSHLVDTFKMSHVAAVHTNLIPTVSVFYGGLLQHPVRIYANEDGTLVVVVSEIAIPTDAMFTLARKLIEWLIDKGSETLVSMDSVDIKSIKKRDVIFGVAEEDAMKDIEKKGIVRLSKGYVGGFTGALMNECIVRPEIKGLGLLVPATSDLPDPASAANLLKSIGAIFSLEVPVDKLIKEGQELQEKLRDLLSKVQEQKKKEVAKPAAAYFT